MLPERETPPVKEALNGSDVAPLRADRMGVWAPNLVTPSYLFGSLPSTPHVAPDCSSRTMGLPSPANRRKKSLATLSPCAQWP
jgi:hypothetical protein